jgi:hypothetical protein
LPKVLPPGNGFPRGATLSECRQKAAQEPDRTVAGRRAPAHLHRPKPPAGRAAPPCAAERGADGARRHLDCLLEGGCREPACIQAPGKTLLQRMRMPQAPVTLTVEQIEQLSRKLSNLRHDINNHLSLIVAAAELIKVSPDAAQRMAGTLGEQPPKIADELNKFSIEFEKLLGITRP